MKHDKHKKANPDSQIQGFGIPITVQGIWNPTNNWKPSSN